MNFLENGATSYLNSVLHVLFMTKDFREAVERYTCENPDTEHLDRDLKDLFDDLQRHTACTYKIMNKLSIDRVYEQYDAAKYFEKILTLTSPDASKIFHGELTHKTICSKCQTEKNKDTSFWHLPLPLMDSNSEEYYVEVGVEEFFRDSSYCREKQMYCDQCDVKVDVTVKCEVKHHPDVLVLLLKRFEFDYSNMRYVRNNCFANVPYTLQIPEKQTYELYAVVEHFGDLRNGNYTATIKNDDNLWYNCSDTSVTLPFQAANSEKSQSLYQLFYRKQTSYLNSVLQVLFMTRDFREAVERYTYENPDTDHVDPHLNDLFDDLERHTAYTFKIINKLGIDTVYEQHSAAESFEKILSLTSPDASQIFHGELTHKTICSKCQTEKSVDSQVWHLPLALMDSCSDEYHVVDGIKDYFRDSHFSGQDQMYCDQCDVKADVTVKCEVKHQPDVLVLLLKKFEFDHFYMTNVNNNRCVNVPYILQIPQNQTYELYAVVDHVGDLREGHYTATIKSQDDNQWYNFNDTRVTLPLQVENTKKSWTVHLLFYRKKMAEVSTNGLFLTAASDNYDQSLNTEQNKKRQEDEERAEVGNGTAEAVECSLSPANIEEKKMEIRVQNDNEEKTGADKQTRGRRNLQTIYDLYCQGLTNYDQGCKQSSRMLCKIHEHQTEVMREGTSATKPFPSKADEVRQSRPEQKIIFTHADSMKKQDKEPENKRDGVKIRGDSSLRQPGSEGSGSLTEEQGVENTKPQKSPIDGKIIEEEIRETPSGSQISTEIKNIKIEIVGRTSQDNMKNLVSNKMFESKSDPKTDAVDTLPESFGNLILND